MVVALRQNCIKIIIDKSNSAATFLQIQTGDLNVNSPYCLPYISHFLLELNRFLELSSPRKWHNKIPGPILALFVSQK